VTATDVISGCNNTSSIQISNQPIQVPAPIVIVYSQRTNCVTPNGELGASVNFNTKDYVFEWYNGTSVTATPDAVGEFYRQLVLGGYTVTATDRNSGCVSAPVTTEIVEDFDFPEFTIKISGTICDDLTGKAEVIAADEADLYEVEWNIGGVLYYGPIASALPSGNFTVTATTVHQCSASQDFFVPLDISVYNGVSRNGDGMNDIFEIGCIDQFPNNRVRIFNRAGTLVYENRGYNNSEVYFNGISNKGISVLGKELPDGTYFYIIDKGDGTEPKTGYLELLR
jgi:gliding motility-associated-like protein